MCKKTKCSGWALEYPGMPWESQGQRQSPERAEEKGLKPATICSGPGFSGGNPMDTVSYLKGKFQVFIAHSE